MRRIFSGASVYDSSSQKFVKRDVAVEDGIIIDVCEPCDRYQGNCEYVTVMGEGIMLAPGLVDVHTHGRAGGDFVSADKEMLRRMRDSYLSVGVTSVMATLASAPVSQLLAASDRISEQAKNEGFIIGIHLEGRYLNEQKRGAHSKELLATPDADELGLLVAAMKSAGKVHVSAAFELDHDGSFAERAADMGCSLGLAHTSASYGEAKNIFEGGVGALTHTFNATAPMHHRDGGAVAAAFLNNEVACEMIVDGRHISPEMVELSYRIKGDKLVLVSDSMEAAGVGDGEYSIAGMNVRVTDGRAVTEDGALAGSTLDLFEATENLSAFAKIPFERALYNSTAAPAKMIGAYDSVGSIEKGKRANFIVLDRDYKLISTILNGETVYTRD